MKRLKFHIIFLFLLKRALLLMGLLFAAAAGPGQAAPMPVASDVFLDGKVLAVDAPGTEGTLFYVLWGSKNGPIHRLKEVSRGEDTLYDMRKIPSWTGKVAFVAIEGLGTVRASVGKPDFVEELKIFLTPELWTPRTVNFLDGHSLFTLKWDRILLLVFLLSTVFLFVSCRRFFLSMILGFIVAWSFLSVRAAWDDLGFRRYAGKTQAVVMTENLKKWYAAVAMDRIKDGRWSAGELSGYPRVIAFYELAEVPFSSDGDGKGHSWRILSRDGRLILESSEEK